MAPQVGTYDISTLLESRFNSQSVIDFGADNLAEIVQRDLDAHNAVVMDMVNELASPTTDRLRVYGTGTVGQMIEVDEFGRSETQTTAPGTTVSFPLRLFQYGVGWTRKYMEGATVKDIALQTQSAQKAHLKKIRYEIKRALFNSSNYTFTDHLIDRVSLSVKRLINADSSTLPDGPDGSTFDGSTHTHYDANATLTDATLAAELSDLLEHGHGAHVMIAINYADVATFTALTNFVPALASYITTPAYNINTPNQRTDLGNQYNRLVGFYGAAEVWVKPWGIANYCFIWDAGSADKPLAFRQRNVAAPLQGLRLAAELDTYPLYAKYFEAEFGFGVWTRTNGVVFRFNNGSYANPTITE